MQGGRFSHGRNVGPSLRLSVKRMNGDKTKENSFLYHMKG